MIRVLHVEDGPVDAALARAALGRDPEPFVVEQVDGLNQAIARLAGSGGENYDVILTDLVLPDGDGLQLIAHVRSRDLPVAMVAVTGVGDDRAVFAALKVGADDYIAKKGDYLVRLPRLLRSAIERFRQSEALKPRPIRVLYAAADARQSQTELASLAKSAPYLHVHVHHPLEELPRFLTGRGTANPFDVLVLEQVPDAASVLDIVKEIRESLGLDLPTVIVTNSHDEDFALAAMRLGVSEYLVKLPGFLGQLPALIEQSHARAELLRERRQLRDSEQRRLLALEAGTMMDWHWDIADDAIKWGRDPAWMFGPLTAGQREYPDFREFVHPDDRAVLLTARERCIAGGGDYRAEFRIRTTQAYTRYLVMRGRGIRGEDGQITRIAGVAVDLTDLRLAEAELARLNAELERRVSERTSELRAVIRELEGFARSVAHDLQEPARAVGGFAGALIEELGPERSPEVDRIVERIERNARRMQQLIDDLLDLARSANTPLERTLVDMSALARESLELFNEVPGSPIDLQALGYARVDPGLFRQVFSNLLSNAVKFTRTRPAPCITVGRLERDREIVWFVRDNGVGFDMSLAGKLFQVFQRLHRRDEFEGSGLGLANVARIVERHGGRVWAEAEPGKGATFYFTVGR